MGATQTAVVNQIFARKYFGGGNSLGRTFGLGCGPGSPQIIYQVVGLVKDTKCYELREEFMPQAFFAAAQEIEVGTFLDLVLRSDMPVARYMSLITASKHWRGIPMTVAQVKQLQQLRADVAARRGRTQSRDEGQEKDINVSELLQGN